MDLEDATVAEVVLLLPLAHTYSYLVPERLRGQVRRGSQVLCPVRSRKGVPGIVFDLRKPSPDDPKLVEISDVVSTRPPWPQDLIQLVSFMASYYVAPLGVAARTAMPGLFARRLPKPTKVLKPSGRPLPKTRSERQRLIFEAIKERGRMEMNEAKSLCQGAQAAIRALLRRGVLEIEEVQGFFLPPPKEKAPVEPPGLILTPHQEEALSRILLALDKGYEAFLLHGVTGSGKTEVYLRAIEEVRKRGRGALVLVPEIALTVEIRRAFESRFGPEVAVVHSAMADSRRAYLYDAILEGRLPIVVGPRSAVFAPIQNLGLIVVDEEHDPSYKQQESLRYNARDLAIYRASVAGCPVVLGSATPSLETFENTHNKKIVYLSIPERVQARPLPEVKFVDMRYEPPVGDTKILSRPLLEALKETVEKGESAILFLNRRGFGRFVLCGACGQAIECPNCSITLTYHLRPEGLRCHYCDHSEKVPKNCPKCNASDLTVVGFGTERLEEEVSCLVPHARCARLDSDTALDKGLDTILSRFRSGEYNVLVGTQVVTKGHDFPLVTLVGVLLAEQSLAFPDFRAAERTFQLLTQVAGRAGRGDRPGTVIIQTYNPGHYALRFAASHDYLGFIVVENRIRKERLYPPHTYLAAIEVSSPDGVEAKNHAEAIRDYLSNFCAVDKEAGRTVTILGPATAAIERLRGRTRYQLLLKSPSRSVLNRLLWRLQKTLGRPKGPLKVVIDVDPMELL